MNMPYIIQSNYCYLFLLSPLFNLDSIDIIFKQITFTMEIDEKIIPQKTFHEVIISQ